MRRRSESAWSLPCCSAISVSMTYWRKLIYLLRNICKVRSGVLGSASWASEARSFGIDCSLNVVLIYFLNAFLTSSIFLSLS